MSRSPTDHLALLDAIHRFDLDDGRWLGGIAECAAGALGLGLGAIACRVWSSGDDRCALDVVRSKAVPHGSVPARLAVSARKRATKGGVARVTLNDGDRCAVLLPTPPATTSRRIADRAHDPGASAAWAPQGGGDAVVIRGTTPNGRRGLLLVLPDRRPIRLSGRRQRALDRIGAQVATAYGLRASLSGRDPFALAAGALSPSACPRHTVEGRSDGLIGRKGTPAAAVELWLGLLAGRWHAVGHRDRDGRRLLLAAPRPSSGGGSAFELWDQERKVLVRTAAGEPLKRVASELGVGPSTASALLWSALRKLRLDSPSEAIRIFSARQASRTRA